MPRPSKWPLTVIGYAIALKEVLSRKDIRKAIAKDFKCVPPSEPTLRRWLTNPSYLDPTPKKNGRPTVVTAKVASELARAARAQRGPFSFPQFEAYVRETTGCTLSSRSLRRWCKTQKQWEYKKARYKWPLTPRQRAARVKWAKDHLNIDWTTVAFADEKSWAKLPNNKVTL